MLAAILALLAGAASCTAEDEHDLLAAGESESGSVADTDEPDADTGAVVLGEEIDELSTSPPEVLPLTNNELSQLLMGGNYNVTQGYLPNGVHAGVDFGGTGNGVTSVSSPVNGTIVANTASCGKVAIYDGVNTIILAHMSNRTGLAVGSPVSIGTYLGKASDVVGGGCAATGAHLHIEIRTGQNASMAIPANNNTNTTKNPLTYTYSPFSAVSLTNPAANSNVVGSPVSFSWQAKQGANSYRLQISQTNAFTAETCTNGCIYNTAASTTSRLVALNPGTYYWRVRAGNSGQGGLWSVVRSFTRN